MTMTDPKNPAFYLRVSTDAQDYPSQLHAIREFCRRKKWPCPTDKNLFSEKVSGAKASRRELDRLLQACRNGEFDCVITFRGDRLGRSLQHMANIYAELKSISIRVIGVADGTDTADDTPGTNALRNMLATFSQLTRETITENTRAGLAAARARGVRLGRPRKNDKKIALAILLRKQGRTLEQIRQRTGLSIGYISGLSKAEGAPDLRSGKTADRWEKYVKWGFKNGSRVKRRFSARAK